MFKRNIVISVQDDDGFARMRVTPIRLMFSLNGDLCGVRVVDEETSRVRDLTLDGINAVHLEEGGPAESGAILARFDVPAEESDDGAPINPARRRDFLRQHGSAAWRTLGRDLAHLPSDAFRIVYSHGLNARRVKDVWFLAYKPGSDGVAVKDITNKRKQTIPVRMLLTVTDPRSGGILEDEGAIRTFAQGFARRPLLAMMRTRQRVPEIA